MISSLRNLFRHFFPNFPPPWNFNVTDKLVRVLCVMYSCGVCVCVHACACMLSSFIYVQLSETPWTVAHQAPLSMEFSRLEYWNGLPCPPPGDLPNPGLKSVSPASPALQADSLADSLYISRHISFIALWRYTTSFTSWRSVATLQWASLSLPFFQWYSFTSCLYDTFW